MLDEVCVAGVAALGSDASAVLGAELAERRALDVAQVGDGDDHLVVGIEVLGVEVAGSIIYVGAAVISVFFADLDQLIADDGAADFGIIEN